VPFDSGLTHASRLHGLTDSELNERKKHLLDLLEIAPYEYRLINALSGGQQRRVCGGG
jgi:energy-coupling factor transporter ATP-binding protein EcfA2